MNSFASTETSQGLLKDTYDDTVADALKKKRKRLAETKIGLENDEADPPKEG